MAQPAGDWEHHRQRDENGLPPPRTLGSLHGPVADMHRAIEAKLREDQAVVYLRIAETPLDVAMRRVSSVAGWGALTTAFVAVGLLLR